MHAQYVRSGTPTQAMHTQWYSWDILDNAHPDIQMRTEMRYGDSHWLSEAREVRIQFSLAQHLTYAPVGAPFSLIQPTLTHVVLAEK